MDLRANAIIQGVDRFSPMMKRIGAAAGMFGGVMGRFGQQSRSGMRSMGGFGTSATMFGAGLGILGRSGFDAAYGLEKMMNNVQAVGQLTASQRKNLEEYAQSLNALYPFTNKEIGGQAFELFRAGFTEAATRGSLKSTLDLALAGDIERSQSADIITNVLTGMRLPMQTAEQASESATKVADVLAYAATKSNTDVRLLGETFKYVAPLAAAAGISIYGVAASAMTMANNGIKGSESGIAMRSALVRMAKPTKDMLATLGRLNIDINDFIHGRREISADDIISSVGLNGIDASGQRKRIEAMLKDEVLRLKPAQLAANLTDLIASEVDGAADRNVIADALLDTLTASGQNYDLLGFVAALREKKVGVGEISRIMDIRQGGRVLTMLLDDLIAKEAELARESKGAARRMAEIRNQGTVGALNKMAAAYENFWVSVGNSGAMGDLGTSMFGISEFLVSLSKTNPDLLRFGAHLLTAAAGMAALGFAAMGLGGFFASPLIATVSIVGMVGLTKLMSNWDKLELLFNEPHEIDIIFPELPDWLKNAWDWAVAADQRARQQQTERAKDPTVMAIQKRVKSGMDWLWDQIPEAAERNRVPSWAAPSGFAGAGWATESDWFSRARAPVGAVTRENLAGLGMPPLPERRPLVRDISPTAGSGRIEAELTGSADVKGDVNVVVTVSPSKWFESIVNSAKGRVEGQLNTGKSMPDAGKN